MLFITSLYSAAVLILVIMVVKLFSVFQILKFYFINRNTSLFKDKRNVSEYLTKSFCRNRPAKKSLFANPGAISVRYVCITETQTKPKTKHNHGNCNKNPDHRRSIGKSTCRKSVGALVRT